jgi:microcin C transport system substrate-binding protein
MRLFAWLMSCAALFVASLGPTPSHAADVRKAHGIAIHGEPALPADFTHLPYANPDAPKGGSVTLSATGSFDTLNPFTLRGRPAAGIGLLFESLMTPSMDEPYNEYALLAESIETPEDRSWAIFDLNPKARWHDGKPVTADDVIWSFETLRSKGHPQYRVYYSEVAKAEKLGPLQVKFSFDGGVNRELPVIIAQLSILPKHYWEGRDFEATTLDPPLGSGPYRVKSFEPGRYIEYERVKDYWGADVPMSKGQNNFDTLRYEYYRDEEVQREAFKAGHFDFKAERSSRNWQTGYDFPAVNQGLVKRQEIADLSTRGMQGFIYNIRKPLFQDPRVREALSYAWDFEWVNKTLSDGKLKRDNSYFSGGELASSGLPTAEELEILEPFRGQVPDAVFTKEFQAPTTDGSGNNRANLRAALKLLKDAGWTVKDGALRNAEGRPFEFEMLLVQPAFERIALPMQQSLEKLGVKMSIRTVDTAQYQNRTDSFDFDMTVAVFGQSDSPGNEQREYWGSKAADQQGSRNLIGIKDPVIDQLIELIVRAPDRDALIVRTRALDRVLLWGHYLVPHFHTSVNRIAFWDRFGYPERVPKRGIGFPSTWWFDPEKAAALERAKAKL